MQEDLSFYLEDLFKYVQNLKKSTNNPEFIDSFEKNMRNGLLLIQGKEGCHDLLNVIRSPDEELLKRNKYRYLNAIKRHKGEPNLKNLKYLIEELNTLPLFHATKNKDLLLKNGILTARSLWENRIKTCANAMDIAIGLHFYYTFFTHGFVLKNFSREWVSISDKHLKDAIISSVDIYKIVLIKNNLENKGIIPTEKWLIAIDDYLKQLFKGMDFIELKANYILAYFDGNINKYNRYVKENFYSKDLSLAPPGEYPFFGEIKVLGDIAPDLIISKN